MVVLDEEEESSFLDKSKYLGTTTEFELIEYVEDHDYGDKKHIIRIAEEKSEPKLFEINRTNRKYLKTTYGLDTNDWKNQWIAIEFTNFEGDKNASKGIQALIVEKQETKVLKEPKSDEFKVAEQTKVEA